MCIYIYIYIYDIHVYIYIYIHTLYVCMYVYIYIYIYYVLTSLRPAARGERQSTSSRRAVRKDLKTITSTSPKGGSEKGESTRFQAT